MLVEAAVESLNEALDAQRLGADRIELCADLSCGGITPSAGTIALAAELVTVPVFVMIRVPGGRFTATTLEYDVMLRDIVMTKQLGADGIVLGVLTDDDRIDVERTRALVDAAHPLPVTFHMAFDRAGDRTEAFDALLDTGVQRVLTSGGSGKAADGVAALTALVSRAAGRLTVVAGGGVQGEDVPALATAGVDEVHARLTSPARLRAIVQTARHFN